MMLSGGEVAVKLAGSAAKNAAAMLLALARNHKKVYGKTSLKTIKSNHKIIKSSSKIIKSNRKSQSKRCP